MAKADTGASQHYFKNTDAAIINKIQKVPCITDIQLPDNSTIDTSHVGILPLHQSLINRAKQVQVLPKLTNSSLLSTGQLCDDNCTALFRKHDLHVFKNNKLVLKSIRNYLDGLWDVPCLNMITLKMLITNEKESMLLSRRTNHNISSQIFIMERYVVQLSRRYKKQSTMINSCHGR